MSSPPSPKNAAAGAPSVDRTYIAGPTFDRVWFIYAPVIALALGMLIWSAGGWGRTLEIPLLTTLSTFMLTTFLAGFVHAHLVVSFFRSNANLTVFRQFPLRFTLVPVLLFGVQLLSPWVAIFVTVLAVWWDVYHSSLQTFGLGRIYEARAGNDVNAGRRVDYLYNLVIYIGPILGGVNFFEHVKDFGQFELVGSAALAAIPAHAQSVARPLTVVMVGLVLASTALYIWKQRQLAAAGNPPPPQKVALYTTTALTSVLAWGFLPPLFAFFVMNVFHAVQYFAIVWWSEQRSLKKRLHLPDNRLGSVAVAALIVGSGCAYGFGLVWYTDIHTPNIHQVNGAYIAMVVLNTVAILHFWFDGFIWSVRKKAV